ncbi:hypothetical protein EYC84_010909 [Monilinia fructicola]|uniref:Uncharacterized protein n=1 Tax=Monilinia fructicola TaxID=38448 RepID=A0A5M9JBB3_MONFR|nr:hypothetical protein EYC84_010909 [Monilinia fructicola]
MASNRGETLLANCRSVWSDGDYELDVETDDYECWQGMVRKDYGNALGGLLTMTPLCDLEENAWAHLGMMWRAFAGQEQSGRALTKEQNLRIFGGSRRQGIWALESFVEKGEGVVSKGEEGSSKREVEKGGSGNIEAQRKGSRA